MIARPSINTIQFVGVSSSADDATVADAPAPAATVATILNINSIPDSGRREHAA